MSTNDIKPIYIFDIDGTLANIEHRVHILSSKEYKDKWRVFYGLCDRDAPIWPVIDVMETLKTVAMWRRKGLKCFQCETGDF